jgi:hypothetical protein
MSRNRWIALTLAFSGLLAGVAEGQEKLDPPLRNWPAPFQWSRTEQPSEEAPNADARATNARRGRRYGAAGKEAAAATAAEALPSALLQFVAVLPCRAIDTRGFVLPPSHVGPPLTANVPRDFLMTGLCNVPSGAQAISVNVTLTNTGATGGAWVTLWPQGSAYPGVSTVNWSAGGQTVANAAIVPLSDTGAMTAEAFGAGTDLIVDVNGYYVSGGDLSVSSLRLPLTTATGIGVVTMGADRFLHGWDSTAAGNGYTLNTFLGFRAGNFTMSGGAFGASFNTAIGSLSLPDNTAGFGNTAVGNGSLWKNTTGEHNTAVGTASLPANLGGNHNTAVGGGGALMSNVSGSENTALGYGANVAAGNLANATAIGAGATVDASNKVRIGNASVTVIEGQVAFSVPSDRRGKKDIELLDLGLDFVRKLRPVSYRLQEGNERLDMGFVAQEVEAVLGAEYNILSLSGEERRLSMRYTDLIAPLVKALQEIDQQRRSGEAEVAALRAELALLRGRLAEAETRFAGLESRLLQPAAQDGNSPAILKAPNED